MTQIIPQPDNLAQLVFFIRGEKVLLDTDLADLYGVETGALNRAVKRNIDRFPADFMLQLTSQEWENLKCQIGISSASASSNSNSSQAVMSGSRTETLKSQFVMSSAHGGATTQHQSFAQ